MKRTTAMSKKKSSNPNQLDIFDGETARQTFVRLVNARSTRVVKAIQAITYLADQRRYPYTNHDIERIFDTLASAVGDARKVFTDRNKSGHIAVIPE
jgi:hypothetical protein